MLFYYMFIIAFSTRALNFPIFLSREKREIKDQGNEVLISVKAHFVRKNRKYGEEKIAHLRRDDETAYWVSLVTAKVRLV